MSVVTRLKRLMLQSASLALGSEEDPRQILINSIETFLKDDKLDLSALKQAIAMQRTRAVSRVIGFWLFYNLILDLLCQGYWMNALNVIIELCKSLQLSADEVWSFTSVVLPLSVLLPRRVVHSARILIPSSHLSLTFWTPFPPWHCFERSSE